MSFEDELREGRSLTAAWELTGGTSVRTGTLVRIPGPEAYYWAVKFGNEIVPLHRLERWELH